MALSKKSRQLVTPAMIRAIFGDSLEAMWWPGLKPFTSNLIDLSGNGYDCSTASYSAVNEAGVRQLAPGLYGKSAKLGRFHCSAITVPANGVITMFAWGADLDGDGGWLIGNMAANDPTSGGWGIYYNADGFSAKASDGVSAYTSTYTTLSWRKPELLTVELDSENDRCRIWINRELVIDEAMGIGTIVQGTNVIARIGMGTYDTGAGTQSWDPFLLHSIGIVNGRVGQAGVDRLVELSGVEDLAAYNVPEYVSDYPSVISAWKGRLMPDTLYGFWEGSAPGDTLIDYSGNDVHGTYGNPDLFNTDPIFGRDGRGIWMTTQDNTIHAASVSNYPALSGDQSVMAVWEWGPPNGYSTNAIVVLDAGNTGAAFGRVYDNRTGGRSFGWTNFPDNAPCYRTPLSGHGTLQGSVSDQTTNQITYYENGLPIGRRTGASLPDMPSGKTLFLPYNCQGQITAFAHAQRLLTHDDFYGAWLDLKPDARHYFRDVLVDELGLATLGTAGDIVCHLPLWETAGGEACDVSMHENHSVFIGGPTLGEDPLIDGFLHSIYCPAGACLERSDGYGIDASVDSFTFATAFRTTDSGIGGIFAHGDGTAYIGAFRSSSANVRLQLYDGATTIKINVGATLDDDQTHRVVGRWNAVTERLDLWLDGQHGGGDASAATMPSMAGMPARWGAWNHSGLSSCQAHNQPIGLWRVALSDADCLALSGG